MSLREHEDHLGELYGQARSFPSLELTAIAAKVRLFEFENYKNGGLKITQKVRSIEHAISQSDEWGRYAIWFQWFRQGILANIQTGHDSIGQKGLSIRGLLRSAAGPARDNDTSEASLARQRKKIQGVVRKAINGTIRVDPVRRMRYKLERWRLGGFPGRTAERCIDALKKLQRLPPRVASATLRTLWNGWCAESRF